jgi:hypothetical protein
MDESSLDFLPHPIHGLIFCSLYSPVDKGGNGDTEEFLSESIWFANQVCCSLPQLRHYS